MLYDGGSYYETQSWLKTPYQVIVTYSICSKEVTIVPVVIFQDYNKILYSYAG